MLFIAHFSQKMGKKSDISSFLKGQIIALHAERCSQCEIAKRLKVPRQQSFVILTVRRLNKERQNQICEWL